MELYKKNSQEAFDMLYKRYVNRIVSYLRKRSLSDKEVSDLVQEVFLKLHRSREQYSQMLPLAPWIFSITRSVFLDSVKKKKVEVATPLEVFESVASNEAIAEELMINKTNQNEKLTDLLSGLTETQRQVIGMRIFDEATFDEISSRLSTSPENVRQIFSRTIRKLKSNFKRKES